MSIRSSQRANKGKNPRVDSPEAVDLRNEESTVTALPTQPSSEAPLPLGRETQQSHIQMPETLQRTTSKPIRYDPKIYRLKFPDVVEINGDLQPGSDDDQNDDDRALSETSHSDLNPIDHPEINHPSYAVNHILRIVGIKKDWENTAVVKAGDIFNLETASKAINEEAFNIAEANGRTGLCT
jgi:hypothetical protein